MFGSQPEPTVARLPPQDSANDILNGTIFMKVPILCISTQK